MFLLSSSRNRSTVKKDAYLKIYLLLLVPKMFWFKSSPTLSNVSRRHHEPILTSENGYYDTIVE